MSITATAVVAEDDGAPARRGLRDLSMVESLVEQLHAEYGVDREQIRSRASELLETFATARVQAFVPILVEKALRETCRASSRAVALG